MKMVRIKSWSSARIAGYPLKEAVCAHLRAKGGKLSYWA